MTFDAQPQVGLRTCPVHGLTVSGLAECSWCGQPFQPLAPTSPAGPDLVTRGVPPCDPRHQQARFEADDLPPLAPVDLSEEWKRQQKLRHDQ